MLIGPDPNFPYLSYNDCFSFPDPKKCDDWVVAVGGNLSPGMLLSAYEQGIFPWYGPNDPVIWQSPDPRFVLFPDKLHISASMQKILKKRVFKITFNTDFYGVINGCAQSIRLRKDDGVSGTWITKDIIEAYAELYRLGYAHSAEAWFEGDLVGGCYGLLMGKVFMGESMFAKKSNASKAAFLTLAQKLFENGINFIDCQTASKHLESLGAEEISRETYLALLRVNNVVRD